MSEIKDKIVQELRRIAHELGRPPKRDELSQHTILITRHDIEKNFGIYTEALKAAGLDKKSERQETKARVDKFFQRGANDLIRPIQAKPLNAERFRRTAIIGDLHFPWASQEHLMLAYQFIDYFKPESVIQMGDIYDFYSYSKFPRSHVVIRPDEEVDLARQMASSFWESIRRMCPKASMTQLVGNHDIRPHKRLIELVPELEALVDLKPLFTFDGVNTIHDSRTPYVQDNVSFIHGFTSPGAHRAKIHTHVVHGHTHRGALYWTKDPQVQRHLFELDVGYLGAPEMKCFNYTPVKELSWTRGMGILNEYGPAFIPFE